MERTVNLLAAILTIMNFVYVISLEFSIPQVNIPSFTVNSLTISIFVFLHIEFALAYFFGKLIVKLDSATEDNLVILPLSLLCVLSSWVSFYNISIFLDFKISSPDEFIKILFVCAYIITYIIALAFVKRHWKAHEVALFHKIPFDDYISRRNDPTMRYEPFSLSRFFFEHRASVVQGGAFIFVFLTAWHEIA